jgi:preprotein translocase subunit Sss1
MAKVGNFEVTSKKYNVMGICIVGIVGYDVQKWIIIITVS